MVAQKSISVANALIQKTYSELSNIRDKHSDEYKTKSRKLKDLKEYVSLSLDNTMKGQDEFFHEETLKVFAGKWQL